MTDYIEYCNSNNLSFTYLTQYYPPNEDLSLVKEANYKHMLFSHLSENIQNRKSSQITDLFIKFLEDKGLSMKKVDDKALYRYLVRMFNPVSGQGKIQHNSAMVEGIPDSFHSLMNNISVLSQEISRHTEGKRVPVVDFRVWPNFKFTKHQLRELLENEELDQSGYLSNREKNGGELCAYAKSVIIDTSTNKGDWLYLEYGYKVVIEKGDSDFSSFLYSHVYGKNFGKETELYLEKKIASSTLSDKVKCLSHLSKLIYQVCTEGGNQLESTMYKISLNKLSSNFKECI